ncbi:unnamed protein product [Caenorhabditis bovis]|uniref:Uncharacterized protein n=1 Tax=Caenorhabditis bovis TaxID=2654633 RepID=A0A8S1EUA4_9PELO|nr:unnamed protein product [Caenorhabditis bovis]
MNGFASLCSLHLQHPHLGVLQRADGILFDSCPIQSVDFGWRNFKSYSDVLDFVISEKTRESNALVKSYYQIWKLVEIARDVYQHYRNRYLILLGIYTADQLSCYHYLMNHPNLPKILAFVYSDADIICYSE